MLFYRPRFAWLVLLGLLATFPLVALCASLTGNRFRNELVDWVDQDSLPAQQYADFRNKFGVNEFVLITWEGCDLGDDRLAWVETALQKPDLKPWVERVSSGQTIYRELIQSAGISDQAAKRRLTGSMIGSTTTADTNQTGIFLELTESGRQNRSDAFAAIMSVVGHRVEADQIQWAGLGHDLYVLDKDGFESPFLMVPWIMLTAFLLTWLFVRDLSLALFINALGTYCGCLAFTFIFFTDFELNAIVWPLPTLMTLLTISASLHFLGYYRSAVSSVSAQFGPDDPHKQWTIVQKAWSDAWRPTLYCSVTTAAGLISLTLSHTQPVRQFGVFGSISILSCSALTLIAMPAWLVLFPPRSHSAERHGNRSSSRWQGLAGRTKRYRKTIIVGGILLLAAVGASIPKIRTGTELRNFFPPGHPVLKDAGAVEEKIGPLSSIELLLQFQDAKPKNDVSRIELIDSLSRKIVGQSEVACSVSAATFSPAFRSRTNGFQRVVRNRKVERLKEELQSFSLLHAFTPENGDTTTETWRVSLRYSSLTPVDLESLAELCRREAARLFLPGGECVFEDEQFQVIATGEFMLFDHLDRQFLTDLLTTYSTAFVLVFVLVLIVLRSIPGAILAAIPNLLPAVLVFGAAGILGLSLDAASLMTASVALGIAVDDTLHMVIWWRNGRASGATADQSLVDALSHCGMAVLQTSVICGVSIGLYAFCGFLPTVRFGILLFVMLITALVGDLVMLPALLSTSLARKT